MITAESHPTGSGVPGIGDLKREPIPNGVWKRTLVKLYRIPSRKTRIVQIVYTHTTWWGWIATGNHRFLLIIAIQIQVKDIGNGRESTTVAAFNFDIEVNRPFVQIRITHLRAISKRRVVPERYIIGTLVTISNGALWTIHNSWTLLGSKMRRKKAKR